MRFVYDCPDYEEFDIFTIGADGIAAPSEEGLRKADDHGCMLKNMRGDRFTLLAIPEEVLQLDAIPGAEGPHAVAQSTLVDEQVRAVPCTHCLLLACLLRMSPRLTCACPR